MSKIKSIQARQILDSRGIPTVEVDVITDNHILGRASVPSGASKGKNEAFELRDNKENIFLGKGVLKAVQNVNDIIAPELIGKSVLDQIYIDQLMLELDGTTNKRRLGSNAILAISLATAKAASNELNIPLYKYIGGVYTCFLPIPLINIVNGGLHSNTPSIVFQEFMIVPVKANTFIEALQIGHKVFYQLKNLLNEKGFSTNVGDEGGFSPNFNGVEDVLDHILEAIHMANYEPYDQVAIAIDCAASEFYENGKYNYSKFEKKTKILIKSREEHVNYLSYLIKRYPIISIEDGMDQNDWEGWKLLTHEIGNQIQLVGDDLFVTQAKKLNEGIEKKVANSILIKVNQVGTLTETIETIHIAKKNKYKNIISHRSGDTDDSFIADLSVAFNIEQIKIGSLCRFERISKYNQLLRIENTLGKCSYYSKWSFMSN
ncbi:Enolase [Blattabacterium sp. (Nauphoeta cinerea)]|uniref:phosphopyruvate hydratase n=1 Tax=Blattabacterium sp. (Nauphoeta cinerea) TaxID=1316444 RepID=UPI0003B0CAEF|nr:phosphopyruvate hydratase [Blattabacterium sp. (Nauphoeta cinerea)]AGW86034.1 Enolase [Blattabacterium sp. (Nauphoeta cinerea)]